MRDSSPKASSMTAESRRTRIPWPIGETGRFDECITGAVSGTDVGR